MKPFSFRQAVAIVLLAVVSAASGADSPHIGYVYPAGGQQGTTFRIEAGGQHLRGADHVVISGEGVRASVIEYARALSNQEMRDTQSFLRDLVRRRWSASVMQAAAKADAPAFPDHPWLRDLDEKTPDELARLRTRLFDPKKQPNLQISEAVEIEVTIDPDAPPGDRELRLATPEGLSNPMLFQVGSLPEAREEDCVAAGPTPVLDLPALLNGQIMPGEVDRFRLRARRGQQLVVRVQARALIPYLADAVPGWFQATVALYAPGGTEVAFSDDFRFDPDPVLFYEVPADGVYTLEVRDAIYRGREDFVYRIAVGELPFVTRIFPLGGREGEPLVASLAGWNLPTGTLQLDTSPGGGIVRRAAFGADAGLCSEIRYAVNALPQSQESEPNNGTSEAQQVALPLVINGRIDRPGDLDVFAFEGRAGQEIVAEVHARRLNSPLDSALRLLDPAGAELAANDDHTDPSMGLVTHHADSYLRVALPEDGTYRLCLSDTQRQGGDAFAYRLRLGPPEPDFCARITPSSVNVAPGRSAPVTLHVIRRDGFEGDVEVALVDAPPGFTLSDARVPGGEESVEARITAPREAPGQFLPLRLEARAQTGDATVTRPVAPAEEMMQAFIYWHVVPGQQLLVALTGSRPVPVVWRPLVPGVRLASDDPVRIPLGGTAQVRLQAPPTLPEPASTPLTEVRFRLANRTGGVTLREATVGPNGLTLSLKADANIARVGHTANAIVEAFVEPPSPGSARKSRVSVGVLPAIPFEITQR